MMIVFIAEYPQLNDKEGMAQRIKDIDNLFIDYERIYLEISTFGNKKIIKESKGHLTIYKVNYFLHRKFVSSVLRAASNIYVQTIYNFKNLMPYRKILKQKNVILDFHGIVPEEIEFIEKKFWAHIFGYIEKQAVKYVDYIVFVTNAMKDYVKQKYPKASYKEIVYPIIQEQVLVDNIDEKVLERYKSQLNLNDEIIILYSGNCQKWQNIDLMVNCIKENTGSDIQYIILTGELDKMDSKIREAGIEKNVILQSVEPHELPYYYYMADYGFILRDDIPLNRVACPTKLIEYLYYNMMPIVKCEMLGDFFDLGYEYVSIDDVKIDNFTKKCGDKNKNVILELMKIKQKNEIRNIIQNEVEV